MLKIKEKDRVTLLNALRAGVVPATGLNHIQVGRVPEIAEMVKDLSHIESGGSTVRFIVGDFGTGKSFFLTLCKLMAHEKRMVVVSADVTTEKILCASDGKARSLLTELLKNLSCRSKPEGNGLRYIIESWIGSFLERVPNPAPNDFQTALLPLSHLTLSQDFGHILLSYLDAFRSGDAVKLEKCLKWLRAEYETKTEAKNDLGVNRIIEDSDFYDTLKLYAGFSRLAGFSGFFVNIDELAVMVRLKSVTRNKNYESILNIINDCHKGSVEGLGFLFGATSEVIENKEKGLSSYGALETRLAENRFANGAGVRDLTGPVMRLAPLTLEELYVLLNKLKDLCSSEESPKTLIDDEGIRAALKNSMSRLGAESFVNPREVIKDFLSLLSLVEANPGKTWRDFIKQPDGPNPSQPGASGLVRLKVG